MNFRILKSGCSSWFLLLALPKERRLFIEMLQIRCLQGGRMRATMRVGPVISHSSFDVFFVVVPK